jgi:hypothetical protein
MMMWCCLGAKLGGDFGGVLDQWREARTVGAAMLVPERRGVNDVVVDVDL